MGKRYEMLWDASQNWYIKTSERDPEATTGRYILYYTSEGQEFIIEHVRSADGRLASIGYLPTEIEDTWLEFSCIREEKLKRLGLDNQHVRTIRIGLPFRSFKINAELCGLKMEELCVNTGEMNNE